MGCATSTAGGMHYMTASVSPAPDQPVNVNNARTSFEAQPTDKGTPKPTQPRNEAIAIVGMGCRTPGADNIREFWRVLRNCENHITDVPEDRWHASAFLDPDPKAPGKAYVQKGGFLKNLVGFDNGLYGINGFEAAQMDPQQFLLLECTSMALEDAGIPHSQLSGSNTGVYIGSMNCDKRGLSTGITNTVDNFTAVGASPSVMAGRMSYVFNLLGPSMVLDTACSSALVAIHQACQAIHCGDCDIAVCAGVNAMLNPDAFNHLSKARMISPTGQCHTFSDEADGYTRGEGCGVVILKRLDDALRDGDKVWATVCTGTNQDGRTVSPLTAPSGEQQKKLLHAVYDKFQVDANQIDYVEAHGTGTPAGDPVEVNAIGSFFKERGGSRDRYIGSVKSNIGHTESAAGILSVIKICLMMKHEQIVPSLNCEVVNPKIDLADLRFIIPKPGSTIPWSSPDKTAGCNSFGFSGSNCHAVLKSYRRKTEEKKTQVISCIVCFTGRSRKSLKDSLTDFLADDDAQELKVQDVSYTSTVRRHHYPHRAAFLVEDMQELRSAIIEQLPRDQWSPPASKQPDVIFVFCGMGTAWNGMCRELLAENRVFKNAVMEVEKLLAKYVSWSLSERLLQEDVSSDLLLSPIATFACQVGLAAMWTSLGIHPACVVGQSIGEVATAYTAGCISLANAVDIIYHRSELLSEVSGGAMIIVLRVAVNKVRQALKEFNTGGATISLEYSDTACAVSASADVKQTIKTFLRSKFSSGPMQLKDLDVSVAYHSAHVSPCADKLASLLTNIDAHPPEIPLQSSVTGMTLNMAPKAEYWADNLRKPVLFKQAITRASSNISLSTTVFLEIGPKPVLQTHVKDLFPGQTINIIPSMTQTSKRQETDVFNKALIALYEKGADIKWKALPTTSSKITDIPRYVFEKTNLSITSELNMMHSRCVNFYQKNHLYTCSVHDKPECYEVLISPMIVPSIYDHVLAGTILVPAAFMAEACLAIAHYLQMDNPALSIQFTRMAPLKKNEVTHLVAEFHSPPDIEQSCLPPIHFRQGKTLIASAHLVENTNDPYHQKVLNLDHIRSKCKQFMGKDEIYATLRKPGFQYGYAYSLLQQAGIGSAECIALLVANDVVQKEKPSTAFHPSILDCVFQSCMLTFTEEDLMSETRLPTSIGRLVVHRPVESSVYVHTRRRKNNSKESVFDMQVVSLTGLLIAEIKDFTIRPLQPLSDEAGPIFLTTTWSKASDFAALSMNEAQVTERPSLQFVTNSKEIDYSCNDRKEIDYSCNDILLDGATDSQATIERLREALNGHEPPSAVVLVFSTEMNDSTDSDSVHNQVVAMCCLIRDILQILRDLSSDIAFYLCTFNAWPAVDGEKKVTTTCPAATALWGLLRGVSAERAYPYVSALELHLPSTSSGMNLLPLFSHLSSSVRLRNYAEILVSENEIFVNLVAKNDSSLFLREMQKARLHSEQQTKAKQTSRMSVSVENHLNIDSHKSLVRIKVKAFSLAGGGDSMDTKYTFKKMASEIRGEMLEGQGTEIASCCPVIVKREVMVHTGSVMPTSLIPDYHLGDLSKLVVLWELHRKAQSQAVTILASAATQHLADLLKLMYCTSGEATIPTISIVKVEDLDTFEEFNETVVSLVLLDSYLLSSIRDEMTETKSLITYSPLILPEAFSQLICFLPDVEVIEMNIPLLFRPIELIKTTSQVRGWIEGNQPHAANIAKALHFEAPKTTATDMNHLLVYKRPSDTAPNVGLRFKKNAAYVVVGGLVGLGWVCVEFLACNNAGYIAILNRRAPNEEQLAAIEKLAQQYNCQIHTFQCDITSMESLRQTFKNISSGPECFQIRGVFMGAALVQDGPFFSLTREYFENVLSAKVKGAWNLHQLLRDVSSDYFVLHSSIASVVGNQGQANYCAGNAFLDGLAFYRRQQGLAAQTINWGPLDMGILEKQDYIKSKLKSRGFLIASHQEVLDGLDAILSLQQIQSIPGRIDASLFAKMLIGKEDLPLRFHKFAPFVGARVQQQVSTIDMSVHRMKSMSPEARVETYESYLKVLISTLMMLDETSFLLDQSLGQLGLDSMNINMMLNSIHRDTSFTIPPQEIMQDVDSVATLAKKLSEYVEA